MQIRLVAPDEYPAVGELTVSAYAPFLEGPDDPYQQRLRDVADRAAQAHVWVAIDDDDDDSQVLGSVTEPPFGSSYRELGGADEGEFRMLAVNPRHQGSGVGTALVEHVLRRARADGRRAVRLSSLPEMAGAHRLYERCGFDRTPDLDWRPVPEVLLIAFSLDLKES